METICVRVQIHERIHGEKSNHQKQLSKANNQQGAEQQKGEGSTRRLQNREK